MLAAILSAAVREISNHLVMLTICYRSAQNYRAARSLNIACASSSEG